MPPGPPAIPTTERAWIGHLLRRAGFGATQLELERFTSLGRAATVDYLLNYDSLDDAALENRLAGLSLDLTRIQDLQRWWLLRMVYTQRPLLEKMTLFWHGILTSGISKVNRPDLMWRQNQLFRQQALGSFDVILKAISRDPAMLIWLDSQSNRKSAPNENFARELMELFSLGVGNYTEQDVRESARAFTGWFLNNQGFLFNASQHDNGLKTFLGQTGNFSGDDVVNIIVAHPAAARYISTRLFTFFAYDNPEPAVIDRLAGVFQSSNWSIRAVVRAIFTAPEFYTVKAYRARPKSPVEYVASMLRGLAIETTAQGIPGLLSRMGQELFDPPNVAGWPGGPIWINSSTLLERINFASRIASDRRAFLPRTPLPANATPRQAADYYSALLIDGTISAGTQTLLNDFAARYVTTSNDAGLRSVVYLTLSSPDYQLG